VLGHTEQRNAAAGVLRPTGGKTDSNARFRRVVDDDQKFAWPLAVNRIPLLVWLGRRILLNDHAGMLSSAMHGRKAANS
jgi:hypothetical protein